MLSGSSSARGRGEWDRGQPHGCCSQGCHKSAPCPAQPCYCHHSVPTAVGLCWGDRPRKGEGASYTCSLLQKGVLREEGRAEGGNGIYRSREEEDRVQEPSLCPTDIPPQRQSLSCSLHQGTPRAQSLTVPCPHQPVGTALPKTGRLVPPSSPSAEPQCEAVGWTRAPGPLSPGPGYGTAKGDAPGTTRLGGEEATGYLLCCSPQPK